MSVPNHMRAAVDQLWTQRSAELGDDEDHGVRFKPQLLKGGAKQPVLMYRQTRLNPIGSTNPGNLLATTGRHAFLVVSETPLRHGRKIPGLAELLEQNHIVLKTPRQNRRRDGFKLELLQFCGVKKSTDGQRELRFKRVGTSEWVPNII